MRKYISKLLREVLNRKQDEPKKLSLSDFLSQYRLEGHIDDVSIPDLIGSESLMLTSMMGMIDEMNANGITSSEYSNTDNWGFKPNGNIGLFDLGFGDYFDSFEKEPETLDVSEDAMLDAIKEKMGIQGTTTYLGGGMYGKAHDLGDGRVLKITKDRTEAINSKRIMGKDMQYLANIYDVKQFNSTNAGRTYFVILLEKLKLSKSFEKQYKDLKDKFDAHRCNHIKPDTLNYISTKHPEIGFFISTMCIKGYEKAWEVSRHRGDLDMDLPYDLDWNDIADIAQWVEGSKENNNLPEDEVPYEIDQMVQQLIK
jgi:hypothetical protein